ncbi:phosphate ABC transporter permease PstA [Agarilytica rhodophyticola]|uniref:phosphate ABC transporter permease PstA n=1 Tax=Agarilytica rhodophyticola TaxID=1737490 RepID=UPI000B349D50|nr:phosphate ABC transporter permease PstA [Agarilytica rhodophyticola]
MHESKKRPDNTSTTSHVDKVKLSLKKRYRAEKRFRMYGIMSVSIGLFALIGLFYQVISNGIGAFQQTYIQLQLEFDPASLGITDASSEEQLRLGDYGKIIQNALFTHIDKPQDRKQRRELYNLVSVGANFHLHKQLTQHPELLGREVTYWLLADDDVDTYFKSRESNQPFTGRLSNSQVTWIEKLISTGHVKTKFNKAFFTSGDSAEPEQAGILGALLGSFFTLVVTLVLSFPIGVAAAIYLEEYAPVNRFTDFIEVNINNLAAVPSVIFGLLGLAIFLNFFEMPRSIPLVGGLVLTLMTLPTIIISSRAAIKAVPPSIRQAALGMGASKMQTIWHHVLPLALPGMMTGTIIGMAQALGETAPLLMIGMVAFIVDIPGSVNDPSTVLPVQIFLWSDSPERAFVERTSAAIMVLLGFLLAMNTLAVLMRKKLERRR